MRTADPLAAADALGLADKEAARSPRSGGPSFTCHQKILCAALLARAVLSVPSFRDTERGSPLRAGPDFPCLLST